MLVDRGQVLESVVYVSGRSKNVYGNRSLRLCLSVIEKQSVMFGLCIYTSMVTVITNTCTSIFILLGLVSRN